MKPFEQRWQELDLPGEAPAYQRVDESHPLDFYLGRDLTGEWLLLLVTDQQPPASQNYQAIHVLSRLRHDGRWALVFRLVKPELARVFSHLCEDLVESSRNLPDPAKAVPFVMARFARWQRLLEKGRSGLLDLHELRGLLGELLFLEQRMIPMYGIEPAVNGWMGPLGADQDFALPDCHYEVKTIRDGAGTVRISSAEQLDLDAPELKLSVVILDDMAGPGGTDIFTPLDLVGRIRSRIESMPSSIQSFEEKLLAAGYLDREEYAAFRFSLRAVRQYRVEGNFPRIVRSDLSSGIGAVGYEIILATCQEFEDLTPE
jgi:hypothetical protein